MGTKGIVAGSLIWGIAVLILSIPMIILLIYKVKLILFAKCFRRDLKVFSGLDIMQCPGPSETHSVVNFGFVCKVDSDKINLEDLRDLFIRKFLGPERRGVPGYENLLYSVIIFGGYPFGKRATKIDIQELIHEGDLKQGEFLEDLLSTWILSKYHKNSPSWEMLMVPLKATSQTAIAFKIHHAFADGYSLLHIFDRLTDNTSPYLVKDFNDTLVQKVEIYSRKSLRDAG
jgi:hypothetical protein